MTLIGSKKIILIVIFFSLTVGFILGFFLSPKLREILQPKDQSSITNVPLTYSKANNLRVDLNSVQRENVALLMSVVRRVYDNDPYAQDAVQALDENANGIGDIIGKFYGEDVKKEYVQLWKDQNSYFISFAKALKNGDKGAKNRALLDLDNYDERTTDFWTKTNPKLDTATYKQLVIDRVIFIRNSIDAYAVRDIARSYKQQHGAYAQIGKVADLIASGIISQFPDRFKE